MDTPTEPGMPVDNAALAAADPRNLNLVIYYNDCIDSDNITAALALLRDTESKAIQSASGNTRIVWILEPRQVALGLGMSSQQIEECKTLIQEHFPDRGPPFKVLIGGLLNDADVESAKENLTPAQLDVLRMAVSPAYGPRGDAELHAMLTSWDFVHSLSDWAQAPVRVFIDYDSLEDVQNPVNLNMHFHEELVTRSLDEVAAYQSIMGDAKLAADAETRRERLRKWYKKCIATKKEMTGESITEGAENINRHESSVDALNFDDLRKTIKTAGNVRFFGGSSLRILQRFIEEGIADKIQCHLQVGSVDLSDNLFANQFNVALNVPAAKYVFQHFNQFARFTVVPSHSAQAVKYKLVRFADAGHLESRILGFNCRDEPLRIASGEVELKRDYPDKLSPMPDVTSFNCALDPNFGATLVRAQVVDGHSLLFKKAEEGDKSGFLMYEIKEPRVLG